MRKLACLLVEEDGDIECVRKPMERLPVGCEDVLLDDVTMDLLSA